MNFLLDNDVVYKLVAFDLLDEALTALNSAGCTIFVLNTLKYQAKGTRVLRRYGKDVIDQVIVFAESQQQVEREVTHSVLIDAMDSVEGLDAGEMQLLSALLDAPASNMLLTGDKRFINALTSIELLSEVVNKVKGQFLSLEQIIYCVLQCFPFESIKSKIAVNIKHDTCIRSCFGGIEHAEKGRTEENLLHFITGLQQSSGGLLIDNDLLLNTISQNRVEADEIGVFEPSFI